MSPQERPYWLYYLAACFPLNSPHIQDRYQWKQPSLLKVLMQVFREYQFRNLHPVQTCRRDLPPKCTPSLNLWFDDGLSQRPFLDQSIFRADSLDSAREM